MKSPPPAALSKSAFVFVDAVEDGCVRLLLREEAFTVPAELLPDGAHEGSWVKVTSALAPPQADPEPLRSNLGRDDPGGPIKL